MNSFIGWVGGKRILRKNILAQQVSDLIEYVPNEQKKTGKYLIKEQHGNQKKH